MKLRKTAFLIPVFGFMIMMSIESRAQKVFSCQYKAEAEVKAYITKNKSEADLIVYKTSVKNDAVNNNGIWFFVMSKTEADKKVFLTQYKNEAELVIYFTDYKNEAGWKNNAKKQLLN
jgi:hypothetical protein